MIPRGHSAVMANRVEPPDSLDFFPTPPWATRALLEHVIRPVGTSCWEPAAGQGHMAEVLKQYFGKVRASDVHDYGYAEIIGSFLGDGADSVSSLTLPPVAWVITNPPFRLAVEFAERAIEMFERDLEGVALLVRSVWAEGGDRYRRLFKDRPPSIIAQFCERVPMTKGRWDPDASTATSYAWFVWQSLPQRSGTTLQWIPPCRQRLTKPTDRARFAAWSLEESAAPLLEAGA